MKFIHKWDYFQQWQFGRQSELPLVDTMPAIKLCLGLKKHFKWRHFSYFDLVKCYSPSLLIFIFKVLANKKI
jgi:hypothetical protein